MMPRNYRKESTDTTDLSNGKYQLEVRAFNGIDYSEITARQFTVDNQKAQAKGFIPGFSGLVALLALVAATVPLLRRKRA
jgi:hypothetical protein